MRWIFWDEETRWRRGTGLSRHRSRITYAQKQLESRTTKVVCLSVSSPTVHYLPLFCWQKLLPLYPYFRLTIRDGQATINFVSTKQTEAFCVWPLLDTQVTPTRGIVKVYHYHSFKWVHKATLSKPIYIYNQISAYFVKGKANLYIDLGFSFQ